MRFISFFAGIGGIDLGLERAGHECVAQCEIDPYALEVLEKHWPDIPRFGDITKINVQRLPQADLWAGGFPCQDISHAGKQAGIHGERSGLFFDFMLLVREIRPRFLLLENVAALIGRGLDEVLGELASCGYDAEWDCISAAAVGAPHFRNRIFIVAYAVEMRVEERRQCESLGSTSTTRQIDCGGSICFGWGKGQENGATSRCRTFWEKEPQPIPVVDGVSRKLVRSEACYGNAVVPQVAEYIGRLLKGAENDS